MQSIVLAIFDQAGSAASAARGLHAAGVPRDQISVVARNHDEEAVLARQFDATPGAEVEDSRPAARLGELSGQVLAALAYVLPGIGSIVAAGPLAAGLGEAAGHVAGGVAAVLTSAGVEPSRASALQGEVQRGALLLGVHVDDALVGTVTAALTAAGGREIQAVPWQQ